MDGWMAIPVSLTVCLEGGADKRMENIKEEQNDNYEADRQKERVGVVLRWEGCGRLSC